MLRSQEDRILQVSTHTQPFYGSFTGTTRVSRCQKKRSSGLYGARESEEDTSTIRLSATPSGLISDQPPSSPFFMPEALPAATLPIYPGLGQASNIQDCMPSKII